ncbi:MAG: AAA family ATPase [Candidatus Lokiarchaeota archaeon]|nr:AAA family ATPase [Candidatus Lokiarchaeota archaeon]
MFIKKIEIENVKTHKKTAISFKEGLNILYGNNGAGKSTVLEMIGFVLFDFLKSKTYQADYVRDLENDHPQYGTARVWINGADKKIYKITRDIGRTEIEVCEHNGKPLSPPIDTISKFRSWIKKQLGVKFDINLETLFNTAIGIPQGMIVNIFLRSPKERKEYFDEIFQLDIYEKYWENLGVINRKYRDEIVEVQNRISGLIGETKNKENLISSKNNLTEDIAKISSEMHKCQKIKEKKEKKLHQLNELKDMLEEIENNCKQLEIERKNAKQSYDNLQKQLDESIYANKICLNTKQAYSEFINLSNLRNDLIAKNEKLNELKEKLNEENRKYQSIFNTLGNLEEKIDESKFSVEKTRETEPKYQKFIHLDEDLKEINEKITIIKSEEDRLKRNKEKLKELTKKLQKLQEKANDLPKLKKKLEEFDKFEKNRESIKLDISIIRNDLSFFQNNQNKVKNQLCPFTEQVCKNIKAGDFDIGIFETEIKNKKKLLESKKLKLNEINDKLRDKSNIKNQLDELTKNKAKSEEVEKQISNINVEISDLKSKISHKIDFVKLRTELESEKEILKPYHDEYLIHKENAKKLSDLQEKLGPLKKELTLLKNREENITNEIKKYKEVPNQLGKIRGKIIELEDAYNKYQKNINEAKKLEKRKGNLKLSKTKLDELKNHHLQKLQEKTKLKSEFDEDEYHKVKTECEENEKLIIKFNENLRNLQARLDEINEDITKVELKEEKLEDFRKQDFKLRAEKKFISKMRTWLKEFKPKIRLELIQKVNRYASQIYRNIRGDQNTSLIWNKDYEIEIRKSRSTKRFIRLSGGEKMAAALAIRLAILKTLTTAKFAIFDEPTTNLDEIARNNLSKYINNIEGFNQLFVISHDDSFKRHSEYVIKLSKDNEERTQVNYLTNI